MRIYRWYLAGVAGEGCILTRLSGDSNTVRLGKIWSWAFPGRCSESKASQASILHFVFLPHIHVASLKRVLTLCSTKNTRRKILLFFWLTGKWSNWLYLNYIPWILNSGFFSFHLFYWIVWICFKRGWWGVFWDSGHFCHIQKANTASRRLQ